jgi:cysteine desulfurase/selenocysteine lyase
MADVSTPAGTHEGTARGTVAPAGAAPARELDVRALRADFPLLGRSEQGRPLTYLDSAASSQRPRQVLDAMRTYEETSYANVHRGVYALAEEATRRFEAARDNVGRFIGAPDPGREVVFTKNATEAINLVAHAWGRTNLRAGDTVLLTEMEHHANVVPWQMLAAERDVAIRWVPVDDDGLLVLDDLDRLLEGVKLLGVTCVTALGCDVLAFSAHKMLGPTGIGVLWGRAELLDALPPFLGGGEMILDVRKDGFTPNEIPWRFEAGTPPITEAIGLDAAVDYLRAVGMEVVRRHEVELTSYALDTLRSRFGGAIRIYGPPDPTQRGGVVSFALGDVHPHDVSQVLDQYGVCVRAGHHCAKPLMRRLGVTATARASFALYNDRADVDALSDALGEARAFFA